MTGVQTCALPIFKDSRSNTLKPYKKALLYKSLLVTFSDDELAELDFDSLIDSIEQKIVSNQKSIITKNELVKIVLETIKPVSLSGFMRYLSDHTEFSGKRDMNRLIKLQTSS